jgi:[ribosomal protein S18]-alanine N-acetyltransferase
MELVFRNASKDDLDVIMEIERQCFDEDTRELLEVYVQRMECFPDGFVLALHDQEVIGVATSEIWNELGELDASTFELGHSIYDRHTLKGRYLYLSSIAILPKYRSRGYGEQLFSYSVDHLCSKYPEIRTLILIVSQQWTVAHHIYQKHGFQEVKRITSFFGGTLVPPANGIVMKKELNH